MVQYIEKAVLVREIERRIKALHSTLNEREAAVKFELKDFLSFIDTLEVKEVQEEPVSEDLEEAIEKSFVYHDSRGDDFRSDKQIEIAYRQGFETGANWKERQFEKNHLAVCDKQTDEEAG